MLAARSDENRRAITTAEAIVPLVKLLGDGRGVRTNTPQERAAGVLAAVQPTADVNSFSSSEAHAALERVEPGWRCALHTHAHTHTHAHRCASAS